jgi:sulfite exporter TauE/SafE/plastocyanin
MNLWLVFLTGLTSGGVTCAAMQGGLLAGVIANQKIGSGPSQKDPAMAGINSNLGDWGPTSAFLVAKLVVHVLLGAGLGLLGTVATISPNVRLAFQVGAALFMFATAMNLLEVHPIFRYLAFQPPKFAQKLLKKTSGASSLFAPALLGLFTILIPCGVTQAMEVLAITSGSAVNGALIMGAFVLGTAPVFGLIGVATAKLSEVWRATFLRAAAAVLIIMAISGVNGALQVLDSPYTLERLGPRLVELLPPYDNSTPSTPQDLAEMVNGVQKVKIIANNSGYTPTHVTVRAGTPVELTISANGVYTCASSFTFREFGISDLLGATGTRIHTFTPTQKGIFTYTCSMGMYSGTMEVI